MSGLLGEWAAREAYAYICMYVCMYGWMDGWMDVCIYIYIYIYTHIYTRSHFGSSPYHPLDSIPPLPWRGGIEAVGGWGLCQFIAIWLKLAT